MHDRSGKQANAEREANVTEGGTHWEPITPTFCNEAHVAHPFNLNRSPLCIGRSWREPSSGFILIRTEVGSPSDIDNSWTTQRGKHSTTELNPWVLWDWKLAEQREHWLGKDNFAGRGAHRWVANYLSWWRKAYWKVELSLSHSHTQNKTRLPFDSLSFNFPQSWEVLVVCFSNTLLRWSPSFMAWLDAGARNAGRDLNRPGSHSCGNKKGKREKFPKRKEEKRGKRILLDLLSSTVTLPYDKNPQKIGALR